MIILETLPSKHRSIFRSSLFLQRIAFQVFLVVHKKIPANSGDFYYQVINAYLLSTKGKVFWKLPSSVLIRSM